MKTQILITLSCMLNIAGCGSGSTNPSPDMTMTPPAKPALAATQIERMGRATINVAVTNPFDLDYSSIGGGANRDATRDKHSKDANESTWAATWTPILKKTLAIYDGADTVCGNQAFACGTLTGCTGQTPDANRYAALAGVLADDRLYMDSELTTCASYLSVETGSTTDCGGRNPLVDVVDVMYTAATAGAAALATLPVNDGVPKDEEVTDSLTAFPFLSDPN